MEEDTQQIPKERDSKQKRILKKCFDNKWYIVAGIYLLGFVSANIYNKLKGKE